MTQRLSPRGFMAVALCAALFITGCANNSASNQSNYAQRSDDVEAIDTTIEREVDDALKRADARLGDARIRAHSYNGVVLLVGQVPSEELRDMAGEVTSNLRGVTDIHNELTIAARLPASQHGSPRMSSATWQPTTASTLQKSKSPPKMPAYI